MKTTSRSTIPEDSIQQLFRVVLALSKKHLVMIPVKWPSNIFLIECKYLSFPLVKMQVQEAKHQSKRRRGAEMKFMKKKRVIKKNWKLERFLMYKNNHLKLPKVKVKFNLICLGNQWISSKRRKLKVNHKCWRDNNQNLRLRRGSYPKGKKQSTMTLWLICLKSLSLNKSMSKAFYNLKQLFNRSLQLKNPNWDLYPLQVLFQLKIFLKKLLINHSPW